MSPSINTHAAPSPWWWRTLRRAAWAPALVLVSYAAMAKGFDAYLKWPWLDMPTHFCGGMAAAWLFLCSGDALQTRVGSIPASIKKLLALGGTALIAVAWEFFEYLCDVMFQARMNLGIADTLSDLFFGLAGAGFLLGWLQVRARVRGAA